jgi:hypothetical protein
MRPALAVFVVAVVAQWLLPLAGVWRHDRVIARGTLVRIECAAPDPYDPLRGRYLAVRPTQGRVPKPDGMADRGVSPVWATLVAGDDGLSRIESVSLEPVSGPTVIRLVATRPPWSPPPERDTVVVEWPFDRLYLNERLAPEADKLVAGKRTVAEFRLLDSQAVLTDILIEGVPVRELFKRQAE